MEEETILLPAVISGITAFLAVLRIYLNQSDAERRAESDDDQTQ